MDQTDIDVDAVRGLCARHGCPMAIVVHIDASDGVRMATWRDDEAVTARTKELFRAVSTAVSAFYHDDAQRDFVNPPQ